MHPKTISARGCSAGLYLNAKLLARSFHTSSQSQSGMSLMQASMISSRASVTVSSELSGSVSRSAAERVDRSGTLREREGAEQRMMVSDLT